MAVVTIYEFEKMTGISHGFIYRSIDNYPLDLPILGGSAWHGKKYDTKDLAKAVRAYAYNQAHKLKKEYREKIGTISEFSKRAAEVLEDAPEDQEE